MCCLAFEEDFYKIQPDVLPHEGAIVTGEGKQYQVMKVDIPNEYFVLRDENGIESTHGISEFPLFRSEKSLNCDAAKECNGCGKECMNDLPEENENPEVVS